MVDLKMSNEKLRDRARRVVRAVVSSSAAYDVSQDTVLDDILSRCDGNVKLAILVAILGCSPEQGKDKLKAQSGVLSRVLSVENACG